MRQIREVLRLRFASELPQRAIAKSLGLTRLRRFDPASHNFCSASD
jgi:hypothetical protein